MKNILERLTEHPLIFDGAMGTMIYSKGVFINTCYEHLCVTNPKLIAGIHQEYADAGADVIETNTFGANRLKLTGHGLADQLEAINRAAVRLARNAAGPDALVAGSVGPILKSASVFLESKAGELAEIFREQIAVLADEGVDFFLFETFSHVQEAQLAAKVAKEFGRPVFVSMTAGKEGKTVKGRPIEQIIQTLENDSNVDGVGLNCGVGPAAAYSNAERALPHTTKPLVVMANAGLPQEVDGRMIYMASPEYFTEYAKRMIQLGVRGVGGCCGTTPADIATMAKSIKSMTGVKQHIAIARHDDHEAPEVEVIPAAEKCGFGAKLARGEKVTSVEITPPRSIDLKPMLAQCRTCKEAGIDAINIPDGPRASARISPMVAALAVEREVGIETVLHYCCRDRNLIGMQSDLLGGYAGGLRNYLIITGDPPKLGDYPDSTAVFDVDAVGLTQVVNNLNHGIDVGGNIINPPTGILIGVGANPCAVEPERELQHYLNKINAGAEYAITQPIFDPEALLRFMDAAEEKGGSIPVVAGVWPLVSLRNAEFLANEVPGVEIPDAILERMSHAKTKEDGRALGIEIAREICEAISDRVAGYQVSAPFGIVDLALKVLA
ncbi:bifunctional homocysteine S-methyltransferase/methylenetetrahydrofolate reductase [Pontiella agarivorans]|uniref:Bifunctional homocysteine S-methyltransferase/methylenetetrahydrofolate reductase n=1 Tax=Pontiella agarivorans TaxID=3038953 RepID=A0ABU5MZJ2_9BACT|nr:bifunctional homocysteine S-methyltransferase/methylenetetrahydrofolate reductase [Pontiella agarivorans]MDZ8119597.1 bifunctional homocysteine S-methyltransferase/methylenetetrahydrofolate reductase [Pontiella agarivorans]